MSRRPGPSWLAAALLAAAGFLAGVILVVALRGVEHDHVRTQTRAGPTVTRDAPAVTAARGRPAQGDPVPDVVGRPLDEARAALEDAGLQADIASGGGLFGPLVDAQWMVVDQDPAGGSDAPGDATVALAIRRR